MQDCLGCHEGSTLSVHTSHPVDTDYAAASDRPGSSLRQPAEAQKRGARLPGGKVHCFSCHDPGSPWKSHVALPAGTKARAALAFATRAEERAAEAPEAAAGAAVNSMPLCQTCHTYGD